MGNSWEAGSASGSASIAPNRVLSLVIGGQQPYAIDLEVPLVSAVTRSLAASQSEGSLQPFVDALEILSIVRFPEDLRAQWLDNDPIAIHAAWSMALAKGAISTDLRAGTCVASSLPRRGTPTCTSSRGGRPRRSQTRSSSRKRTRPCQRTCPA